MLSVENMTSPKTDKPVANQFIINDGERIMFQSYKSPIVELDYAHHVISVFPDYDYSVTTAKYRNRFFELYGLIKLNSKERLERAMAAGEYRDYYNSWIVKTVE